jgi:hypothetical protein
MEPMIELEFVGEDAPSRAADLSHFLYLYKATYAAILEKFGDLSIDSAVGSYEGIAKDAVYILEDAQRGNRISTLFFSDLGDRDVTIAKIRKESPLLIALVAYGGVALVAAIIAGGDIEFNAFGVKIKARFNRLGDGIAAMRDAFQGKHRKPSKPKRRP